MCIYNLGVLHDERPVTEDPVGMIGIHIADVALAGLEDNCIIPSHIPPLIKSGEYYDQLLPLFNLILKESTDTRQGYENVCQNLVIAILSIVIRLVERYNINSKKDENNYTLCAKIKSYLDVNYNKNIALADLENEFHFNRYYIGHLFKDTTGFSPNQYIINRRIGEAQRLLLESEMPVNRIACKIGYRNTNQFYAIFKNIKGYRLLNSE